MQIAHIDLVEVLVRAGICQVGREMASLEGLGLVITTVLHVFLARDALGVFSEVRAERLVFKFWLLGWHAIGLLQHVMWLAHGFVVAFKCTR